MIALLSALCVLQTPDPYVQAEMDWRAKREQSLKAKEGWLSVAGLYWLPVGSTAVGSGSSNDLILRQNSAPEKAFTLKFDGKEVNLAWFAEGATVNGKPAVPGVLHTDADPSLDKVALGDITFKIIRRGKRTGVRLYDSGCPGRVEFEGLHWFPVEPKLRVVAQFHSYKKPKMVQIVNVLGDRSPEKFPGYLTFKIGGVPCRLEAQDADDSFFLNFTDTTSGIETYGAGRFLDAPKPDKDGKVVVDFNRATCPPCAYTAYATCPLPPKANRLNAAIRAGEMAPH